MFLFYFLLVPSVLLLHEIEHNKFRVCSREGYLLKYLTQNVYTRAKAEKALKN